MLHLDVKLGVPTEVIVRAGAIESLGEVVAALGNRPLLVTGRTAATRLGYTRRAVASLSAANLVTTVFDGVSANPRSDEVDAAVALARAEDCNVVIALGGGSAIDAAKAVAQLVGRSEPAGDIIGTTLTAGEALPIVAVPTISGSGAEVTRGAIVTDVDRWFRSGIRGDAVFPRVALVDPDLTRTANGPASRAAVFDAFSHAVEGIVARARTARSIALGIEVIRIVMRNLDEVSAETLSETGRLEMALASVFGGVSVATVSTCLPHRLQQAMGSVPRVQTAHGAGLAALYPAWVASVNALDPGLFAPVTQAMGVSDIATGVRDVIDRLGLASSLDQLGYDPSDIPALLDGVSGDLSNDPLTVQQEAPIEDLLRRSFEI